MYLPPRSLRTSTSTSLQNLLAPEIGDWVSKSKHVPHCTLYHLKPFPFQPGSKRYEHPTYPKPPTNKPHTPSPLCHQQTPHSSLLNSSLLVFWPFPSWRINIVTTPSGAATAAGTLGGTGIALPGEVSPPGFEAGCWLVALSPTYSYCTVLYYCTYGTDGL